MSSLDEKGSPSIYEYLAAAMLSIFTVWFWAQTAEQFPQFFESAPPLLITAASYAVYTLGGALVSYLVLEKSGSRRVIVGLKVGMFSFFASAAYFYMYSGVVRVSFIVALLFGFLIGGYLGAVVSIKRAMDRVKSSPSDGGKGATD